MMAPAQVAGNVGWQPSGDGQVVKGSLGSAKVLPVGGNSDPLCGDTLDDHSHDLFKEALPDVTVWFGKTADGPWEKSDTLPTNPCGWRRLSCYYNYVDETGPQMLIASFIKVQAFYTQPGRFDVIPPVMPEQQVSCPLILDCSQELKTGTEFDLQLVSGTPDCNTPHKIFLRAPQP